MTTNSNLLTLQAFRKLDTSAVIEPNQVNILAKTFSRTIEDVNVDIRSGKITKKELDSLGLNKR